MSEGRRAADRRHQREGTRVEGTRADGSEIAGSEMAGSAVAGSALESRPAGAAPPRGPRPAPGDDLVAPTERTVFSAGLIDDPEADFADALAGDAPGGTAMIALTKVIERPTLPVPAGGRLVFTGGARAGEAEVLRYSPTLLGRGSAATLALDDPHVSRRHAELVFQEGRRAWVLRDLCPTPGVLHNGVPVEGEALLRHGDLLQFGVTELRFLRDPTLPVPPPAPDAHGKHGELTDHSEHRGHRDQGAHRERTERSTRAPASGSLLDDFDDHDAPGAGGELSSTALRAFSQAKTLVSRAERTLVGLPPHEPAHSLAQRLRRTAFRVLLAGLAVALLGGGAYGGRLLWQRFSADEPQLRAQAEQLLATAHARLAERKLEEAAAHLEAALALQPQDPAAQSLSRTLAGEREARAALEEARALAFGGDAEGARQVLRRIADTSVFAEARRGLEGAMREEEREAARKAALEASRAALAAEGQAEAEAALRAHLEKFPEDAEVQGRLDALVRQKEAPFRETPGLKAARAAFLAGNTARARSLVARDAGAGNRPAQGYLANLDRFEAALAEGKAALRALKPGPARAAFERAEALLPGLAGKKAGTPWQQVARPLANALYLEAMAHQQAGRTCEHAEAILRAGALQPRDAKVQAQARALDAKARAALQRARAAAAADRGRARAIAREALCLAPASSAAGRELRALSR